MRSFQMFLFNIIFLFEQFYLSRSDAERWDREENEDVQREILARHGRNLLVQCRTHSGGTNPNSHSSCSA